MKHNETLMKANLSVTHKVVELLQRCSSPVTVAVASDSCEHMRGDSLLDAEEVHWQDETTGVSVISFIPKFTTGTCLKSVHELWPDYTKQSKERRGEPEGQLEGTHQVCSPQWETLWALGSLQTLAPDWLVQMPELPCHSNQPLPALT